jgi:hypothetical protein
VSDCRICRSARRYDVERLRVLGNLSAKKIATNYGYRHGDVLRHFKEHVAPEARRAYEKLEATSGLTLLQRLAAIEADAKRIMERAEAEGDFRTAMVGVRELLRIAEFLARLSGELTPAPVVNAVAYTLVFQGGSAKAVEAPRDIDHG